jgi:hypothetical protein
VSFIVFAEPVSVISPSDLVIQQVWALAIGKKTEMLATGGTDSDLNLWYDCTMEDKEEDFLKKASPVLYCTFSIKLCMRDHCV